MIIVSGIYVIRNKRNNKVYIGSSYDVRKRMNSHRNDLSKNKHHNRYLQNSWNKYGAKSFEFKILERCVVGMLLEREQFWIDTIGSDMTYNIAQDTSAPMKGLKHTPDALAKMARSHTGCKHTSDTIAKMSIAQKNREYKPHEIARMKTINIGRKATPETRAKLNIVHTNPSDELRYKFGNAMRGKHRTTESIDKYIETRSQEFVVTSPDGIEMRIKGLARFCRQNGLDQGTMSRVAQSGRTHKGWKCLKV